MTGKFHFFFSFLVFGFYISLFSQGYTIKNGTMTFKAVAHTVGIESDLIGTGNGLSGSLDLTQKKFNFIYDMWNIDTGIELRNDHMHENYLETEDYPEASFKGEITNQSMDSISVLGDFTLHGIEKKITITGSIKDNVVNATWNLKLSDYNIEIPEKFLVAKLDENLIMTIQFKLEN